MEIEHQRQLVVGQVGREKVGCVSGSGGGGQWKKWGKAMIEMLGRAHIRRLRGGKVSRLKETGRKLMDTGHGI